MEGETTLRLMKGDYSVVSWMDINRTPDTLASVLVGDPKLTLTGNTTVALDARTAKQVTLDVGRDDLEQVFARMDVQSDDFTASAIMPVLVDEMWAQPMKVDDAEFDFTTRWRLWEPMLTVKSGKQPLDIILQVGSTFLNGEIKATAVNAGSGSADEFAAVDVKGKVAVVTVSNELTPGQAVANAAAAGAKFAILANGGDGELSTWVGSDDYESDAPIAVAAISGVDGRALLADMAEKKVTITAVGDEYADVVYDIARYSDGEIPADLAYAPKDLTRIDTTYHGQKEMLGEFRYDFVPGAHVRLGILPASRARRRARGVGQHRPAPLEPGRRRRVGALGDARHPAHLRAGRPISRWSTSAGSCVPTSDSATGSPTACRTTPRSTSRAGRTAATRCTPARSTPTWSRRP